MSSAREQPQLNQLASLVRLPLRRSQPMRSKSSSPRS